MTAKKKSTFDIRAKQLPTASVTVTDGDEELVLTFRAIGRKAYDDLIAQHPGGESEPYDPETFPPALIAACCVDPDLSTDEAQYVFDEWTIGEVAALFATAVAINTRTAGD